MDTPNPPPSPPRTVEDLSSFDRMVQAKEAVDHVRHQIIGALHAADRATLPPELQALLRADDLAWAEFRRAVAVSGDPLVPIPDTQPEAA